MLIDMLLKNGESERIKVNIVNSKGVRIKD